MSSVPDDDLVVPVANEGAEPLVLVLEPWGECHTLPVGDAVEIRARGPEPRALEIGVGPNRVTVYAWPGSSLAVFRDGLEVNPGREPRPQVPQLPSGMSSRAFVSKVVGRVPPDADPSVTDGLQLSDSEKAELRTLDHAFDSHRMWHLTWDSAIWNWGRTVAQIEGGYGSQGHGIDDLVFGVRVRDPIDEFIAAASPTLSGKLSTVIAALDSRYVDCTVDGTELAEALGEPRPESAWWWRRVPRSGPLHELLRGEFRDD
jgi:hypothetical protein